MQVFVDRGRFREALSVLLPFVPHRFSDMANRVRVFTAEGELVLYVCDGYGVHAEARVPVDDVDYGTSERGDVTVDARILHALVSACTAKELALKFADRQFIVKAGDGTWTLPAVSEQTKVEFPRIRAIVEGELPEVFADLLGQVRYAVAREDNRPILRYVYFEVDRDTLRLTASDGYRLARASVPVALELKQDDRRCEFKLHSESVKDLESLLARFRSSARLMYGEGKAIFETGAFRVALPHSEERYPDVASILTSTLQRVQGRLARVSRASLQASARRAAVARREEPFISMLIAARRESLAGSCLAVNCETSKYRQSEFLEAEVVEDFSVRLNPDFLEQALSVCTAQEVLIGVNPQGPLCVLNGDGPDATLHLIMPMTA